MKDYRHQILYGNLTQVMLLIALPVALNNIIQRFYSLADTWFATTIGGVETASLTFADPINQLIMSFGNGIAIAGTAMMARKIGQGNQEDAKKICGQLLNLALAAGLLLAVGGFMWSEDLLLFFGATRVLATTGSVYLLMIMVSAPLTFILTVFIAYKRAYGGTREALNISFIAMGIKMALSWIFILQLKMGLFGLGLSLVIAHGFITLYIIYDLFWKDWPGQLSLKSIVIKYQLLVSILVIAMPVILEKSALSFGQIIANRYIVGYGEIALAGLGITNRVNSIAFSASAGIGAGLGVIVGQTVGDNNIERAEKAVKIGVVLSLVSGLVLLVIQLLLRPTIAEVFSKGDTLLYDNIMGSMIVIAPSIVFWALFQVVVGTFQGVGMTKLALLISLIRLYVFRVPMIILFSKVFNLGPSSIWYAMLLSNSLTALVAWGLYRWSGWQKRYRRL